MSKLHIANTYFEFELEGNKNSLLNAVQSNPVCMQLQYLPLLYGGPSDGVLVSHPFEVDALLISLDQPTGNWDEVCSWGYSLQVAKWAKEHKIPYHMPKWDVVRTVNSKAFSWEIGEKLQGSALLHNQKELDNWIQNTNFPFVLKHCFGVSGRGMKIVQKESNKLSKFCRLEWDQDRPIIAEPWVDRILDFSSQWMIDPSGKIDHIGIARFEGAKYGSYRRTIVDPKDPLLNKYVTLVQEHKEKALGVLKKIATLGYFGEVGVDAFVYLINRKTCLQSIVEVNARKTLSRVAIDLSKGEKLMLSYELVRRGSEEGLLPQMVQTKGKKILFQRQLYADHG